MPRGIFLIGIGLAAANAPAPAPAPAEAPASTGLKTKTTRNKQRCKLLCQHRQDDGIGGSMQECLTQCSIRLDLAAPHERNEAARRFVEDQSYNEKGGEQM